MENPKYDQAVGVCALVDATTADTTLDLDGDGEGVSVFVVTVAHATTIAFANWPTAGVPVRVRVVFVQDSGGHAVTLPEVLWPADSAAVVTATAAAVSELEFRSEDGGATVRGQSLGVTFT